MTRRTILLAPAVLVSIATAFLLARSDRARAADECVTRPGTSAPQGSHWYYRVDRSSREHCWFLGPVGTKVATAEPRRTQSVTQSVTQSEPQSVLRLPVPRPTEFAGENAYASAVPVVTMPRKKAEQDETAPSFAMRWPSSTAGVGRENGTGSIRQNVSASNYAAEEGGPDEGYDMPAVWPVLAPADRATDRAYAVAQSKPPIAFLSAVIGGALLSFALVASLILRRSPAPVPVRPGRAARARSDPAPKRMGRLEHVR